MTMIQDAINLRTLLTFLLEKGMELQQAELHNFYLKDLNKKRNYSVKYKNQLEHFKKVPREKAMVHNLQYTQLSWNVKMRLIKWPIYRAITYATVLEKQTSRELKSCFL